MGTHLTNPDLSFIPPLRTKRAAKRKPVVTYRHDVKGLYYEARKKMWAINYPNCPYYDSDWPPVGASNGLTRAIINFLVWSGHNADRTGTQGRMIKVNGQYKRIPSANRRGTADVSSTINVRGFGLSVKWEIKINMDKPSTDQLKEQAKEQSAGGKYFFVKTFDDFFDHYNSLFI